MEEEIGLEESLVDNATVPRAPDPRQREAEARLTDFFEKHGENVFFSKQIEVLQENEFYHWLTNRALRALVAKGFLRNEPRKLATGATINLLWHHAYRYYKRAAARLVALVNEYADPNVGAALGLQGEALVLEGFARRHFLMKARDVNEYGGQKWSSSEHNLDFVFERDQRAYGIEVKNTLKYMGEPEFRLKIQMNQHLGLTPVFACRMLPRRWIIDLVQAGGFALILKWQLYPWTHLTLARRVHQELGLPVDSPRRLADGTMDRFMKWHEKRV